MSAEGDNYRCFTTAKKMNAGWMWRIYIHTNGVMVMHTTINLCEEEAIKEIEEN
nr:MAG: hypothetical protein CM15mV30_0980 [uncultured marine virus]